MGRHYLLQREKKSGREQSKLDILALIVRKGEKPIKTKKRVTLLIKRMTSKENCLIFWHLPSLLGLHMKNPSLLHKYSHYKLGFRERRIKADLVRDGGRMSLWTGTLPIQEQRRYSKPSVLK
jgi:hypothetical protein